MYDYQSRPLPIGPQSDVMSTAEPPSTVGPSASVVEASACRKRVDFSISHYAKETATEESQDTVKNILATQQEDKQEVSPSV